MLAGAGTGKTRVLTTRLAHLLMTGRVRPYQVLAVTFTNKAAREMTLRVSRCSGAASRGCGSAPSTRSAPACCAATPSWSGSRPTSRSSIPTISCASEAGDRGADLDRGAGRRAPCSRSSSAGKIAAKLRKRCRNRHRRLRARACAPALCRLPGASLTLNACDFGDLLLHCLTLFGEQPEILADYQRRFRAILVDEYQDSNVAQYLWLRLLAQAHRNLTCVGDDDQSIYSWRGAEVGNILRFEQDFPGAAVVRLECNYRSTGHILGAASGLIAHNRSRLGKTLWTEGEGGERVRIASLWDDQEEARFVGEEIEAEQRAGRRLNDIAVLVRASFQTRAFEERFISACRTG